jgi:predicted nucleotide-binding protein (sugar kinase/HSP70/actin superfamily)
LDEFQKLGYPIFSQSTLQLDEDLLERLFGEDVWKTRYSASTNHKIWAAKFTARHPNLVAMEISNFKCGHDAPIYGVIEGIVEKSHTPYFSFKDLDENKPTGSVKIRVETVDYFLRRHREDIVKRVHTERQVETRIAEYERELRLSLRGIGSLAEANPELIQIAS